MPQYRQMFRDADRQQAIADALTQRAMQPQRTQQTGRIAYHTGGNDAISQLTQALMARKANNNAQSAYADADAAKQSAMAEALAGMQGSGNPFASGQSAIDAGVHPAIAAAYMQSQQPVTPKPTDDQREYEFARGQGYDGSFTDFLKEIRASGASTTNVNLPNGSQLPKAPQGMYYEFDAQGKPSLVAIPGGPVATEQQAAAEQDAVRADVQARKTDVVTDEIDRAFAIMDTPSLPDTGAAGALLKGVPGTDAHSLQNVLKTITANIGFDRLQQMRESSPTGGALGNITIGELERLEAVKGSLVQSQNGEDLRYNLARLNNEYLDIIHGKGSGERRALPELSYRDDDKKLQADDFQSKWDAAPSGTVLEAPDGTYRRKP